MIFISGSSFFLMVFTLVEFFITLGSILTDCSARGTRRRAEGPRFESLFDPPAALFHGSNQPQSSASTVGVDNQFKLNLIIC